jgi:hypothetical protein
LKYGGMMLTKEWDSIRREGSFQGFNVWDAVIQILLGM